MKNLLLWIVTGLSLSSCTSITARIPTSRMESPETPGETWKIRGGLGVGRVRDVVVTSDASARPPVLDQPRAVEAGSAHGSASVGLGERFEPGLKISSGGPTVFWLKYQLIGEGALKAKKDNFSLSPMVGFGSAGQSQSGNQKGTFGPGGYKWSSTMDVSVVDYGLIAGYRYTDDFLLYGGLNQSIYRMSGSIHDDPSDDGTSPSADYAFAANGKNTSIHLDFQWTFGSEKRSFFTAEVLYSAFEWSGVSAQNNLHWALLVGHIFN